MRPASARPLALLALALGWPLGACASRRPGAAESPPAASATVALPEPQPLLQPAVNDPSVPVPPRWCQGGQRFTAAGRAYCLRAEQLTWEEAEQRCVADGGHLAQINSNDEGNALAERLRPRVIASGDYWIGLTREKDEWRWIDGAQLSFAAWSNSEPNNSGGQENCVQVYPSVSQWNDLPCRYALPFLCQLPRQARGTHGGFRPFLCNGQPIETAHGSYCLRSEPASWEEAKAACEDMGGSLATLKTEAEYMALMGAFGAPLRGWRLWLGMTDRKLEGSWVSVTGEPLGYTNWNAGEPNNSGGGEHCGEWIAGGWNDLPCEIKEPSLCEAP